MDQTMENPLKSLKENESPLRTGTMEISAEDLIRQFFPHDVPRPIPQGAELWERICADASPEVDYDTESYPYHFKLECTEENTFILRVARYHFVGISDDGKDKEAEMEPVIDMELQPGDGTLVPIGLKAESREVSLSLYNFNLALRGLAQIREGHDTGLSPDLFE